jgi:hypothetical protein
MQILCATTSAAAQVLAILLAARLRPIHDFEIRPILVITPPIAYTMHSALTHRQLIQIRAIADTTVNEEPVCPPLMSH